MKQRREFTILTVVAFFTGFLLYGSLSLGILLSNTSLPGLSGSRLCLLTLLGGYLFFSLVSGILFTSKWILGKTLKTKCLLIVFFVIPVWLTMAGIIYSIPYGIYNIVQYKRKQEVL